MIGTIKWFNTLKGFGFLESAEVDEDIFIHFSGIDMEGFKTLKAKQEVKFILENGPKGLMAKNVELLEEQAT